MISELVNSCMERPTVRLGSHPDSNYYKKLALNIAQKDFHNVSFEGVPLILGNVSTYYTRSIR